jgi:hypothetical protein
VIYALIETAKLNGIDPQAWLADVFAPLPDHPTKQITDLLPWNWCAALPDDHATMADTILGRSRPSASMT